MKIIFLDIDGVLAVNYRRLEDGFGSGFHPEFVENLKRIIDATGAYLCISSTWRSSGLEKLLQMWEARQLPGFIIDITGHAHSTIMGTVNPDNPDGKWLREELHSLPRGVEIDHWLKKHGKFQRINWSEWEQDRMEARAHVKNYVILDDDSDMLLGQAEHFVKTSNRWNEPDAFQGYGLTTKAADEAITILNSSLTELYYDLR